ELKFPMFVFFGACRDFAAGHASKVIKNSLAYLIDGLGAVDDCSSGQIKITRQLLEHSAIGRKLDHRRNRVTNRSSAARREYYNSGAGRYEARCGFLIIAGPLHQVHAAV